MAIVDFIRLVRASQNFKLKGYEFISFEDLTAEDIEEHQSVPDVLEIMARLKVYFEGEPPESYKILNLIIGDWVEENLEELTNVIHEKLKEHLTTFYPESEHTALDELDNTAIWTDQLDYMPDINDNENSMLIDVELVLHGEPIDD